MKRGVGTDPVAAVMAGEGSPTNTVMAGEGSPSTSSFWQTRQRRGWWAPGPFAGACFARHDGLGRDRIAATDPLRVPGT
jgi:hypothetical protein